MPQPPLRSTPATHLAAILAGSLFGVVATLAAQRFFGDHDLELVKVVRDIAAESFVEEVSDRQLVDEALAGMIGSLDRYSRYYPPSEVDALDRSTRGEFRGIGVVFRAPSSDGQVLFCAPGGPAERAGVRVGDRFLSIDGEQVADFAPGGLQESLQRRDADELLVELVDLAGGLRSVRIQPEPVLDPSVRLVRMVDPDRGFGHISLTSFSSHSLEEFDQAMARLEAEGLSGLVLDLRGNGGGSVDAAVGLANRFIGQGRLVATRSRRSTQVVKAKPQESSHLGLPLVLLVDRDSASASEILAGALQDHGAATLVGEPTYGKGTVQTLTRFSGDRAVVKVTTAHYLTPAWRRIERDEKDPEHTGIAPDVLVPLDDAARHAVQRYVQAYHPPPAALPIIRDWEAKSGLTLLPIPPQDPQLEAALGLLAGESPADSRIAGGDAKE